MNLQISIGEGNLTAGVGVIPTYSLKSTGFVAEASQNIFQTLLVARGERK
jgi:hypothetical protein